MAEIQGITPPARGHRFQFGCVPFELGQRHLRLDHDLAAAPGVGPVDARALGCQPAGNVAHVLFGGRDLQVDDRLEDLRRGAGFEFADEVKGGVIPGQFIPAVEKGVRQVRAHGAVAGYPLQDVRVVVHDGKYHSVDSKEVAFVAAGKKAFLDAITRAAPQVLEPIVDLEVSAPEQHMGDISGGLASKRARINGTDSQRGGEIVVKAQVPLSELEGYAAELKSVTAGRGRYSLDFSHYEPVPAQVQQKMVEAFKPRHDED